MKRNILFLLLVQVFFSYPIVNKACSAFMLKGKDYCIVGFNENDSKSLPGCILTNKRGVTKEGLSWNHLVSDEKINETKIKWTSKYGSVSFNLLGIDMPCYGVNEKGLFIVELYLDKTYSTNIENRAHLFWGNWIQYQLDNYSSVNEVLNALDSAPVIDWWPNYPGSHFFLCDKNGKTAAIELIDGQYVVFANDNMPEPVLCNDQYQKEIENLRQYKGFGGAIEFDINSQKWGDRFGKAVHLINSYDKKQSAINPVEYSWNILNDIFPGVWQLVYDVNNSVLQFRSDRGQGIKELDMSTIDFSTDTPVMYLDIHADFSGKAFPRFETFTPEVNRKYVTLGFLNGNENNDFSKSKTFAAILKNTDDYMRTTTQNVSLVFGEENTGANTKKPPLPTVEQLPSIPNLPDPFAFSDGSGRVETFQDWTRRRAEIKAEIEHYEIGVKPDRPADVKAFFVNDTLKVIVTYRGKTVTFASKIIIPEGDGPFPIVIGMNRPTGSLPPELFDGCIQIPFIHNQAAIYGNSKNLDGPFYQMYPELSANGDYCAWSWGISRLIDGIELIRGVIKADMSRIAVTGCSYAGKMALFAGAFDERVALTIVQESGGGGINAWRISDTLGEVETIRNTNYTWFMQALKDNFNGRSDRLPYDHHELIAMIAPRPVLILGNPDYVWMADESGYISAMAALEVWKAMGIEDRFGFDFSDQHTHCRPTDSQNDAVKAFIDRFLFRRSEVNTKIRFAPKFQETDYRKWSDSWSGHKIKME